MNIPCGAIARGDKFFDRVTDRKIIWKSLKNDHILLDGPRRVGKSSLLTKIAEEANFYEYTTACLIDLSGSTTVGAVLKCIEEAFPDTGIIPALKVAGNVIKEVVPKLRATVGGKEYSLHWPNKERTVWERAEALQKRLSGQKLLICLDEFSLCLNKTLDSDKAAAEKLVLWLKAWRQSPTECRFILSGSIGIKSLVERHGWATHFNDCYNHTLQAFSRSDAIEMLAKEVEREASLTAEAGTLEQICNKTGWLSPFYLNLLLKKAADLAKSEGQNYSTPSIITPKHIDKAYEDLLADRGTFTHWHTWLKRDLNEPHLSLALQILNILSQHNDGLSHEHLRARVSRTLKQEEHFTNILVYLQETGYLGWDDPAAFQCFMVRDHWRRHYANS